MTDCLFCGIAEGVIPADVVHADDDTLAFRDVNPQAPVHVLVIPRHHFATVGELVAADRPLAARWLQTADDVAAGEGVSDGYRLVVNTGAAAGQTVGHVHAHVLGARPMGWPPG